MTPGETDVRWPRILALVVLLLILGEAGARVAVRVALGQPFRSFDTYTFSGYGVWRQNPRYTHPSFSHNAAGFRNDRDFDLQKPPRTLRVMCIGASVLYAGAGPIAGGTSGRVQTDETITAYLEPLLRAMPELEGYDVEVINAGVNRHRTRHVMSYYAAELVRYDPDIVVIFGTNNDGRWIEFAGGIDLMVYTPDDPLAEESRLERLANDASLTGISEKVVRVLANRSALVGVSYRLADRLFQTANQAMAQAMGRVPSDADRQLAPPQEREKAIRRYLANLGALVALVELNGARAQVYWEWLLMTVEDEKPLSPYEQKVVEFLRRRGHEESPELRRRRFDTRDRVDAFLREHGVPMIDLLDAMRSYQGNLYNDYLHYDAAGNRWVAARLAESLAPEVRSWVRAQETESAVDAGQGP